VGVELGPTQRELGYETVMSPSDLGNLALVDFVDRRTHDASAKRRRPPRILDGEQAGRLS
jgi:hypothetical protein